MERVLTPSLFITNSLTQNLNEGLFLFFSPSLNWIKEKSVATLAIHNICDQKQNKSKVSSPTVLQWVNHHWFYRRNRFFFLDMGRRRHVKSPIVDERNHHIYFNFNRSSAKLNQML